MKKHSQGALYEAFGELKVLSEWFKDPRNMCTSKRQFQRRVYSRGWSVERALTTPLNKAKDSTLPRHLKPLKPKPPKVHKKWRMLSVWGETKSLKEWSRDPRCVVCTDTLRKRINRGWNIHRALTAPPGQKLPYDDTGGLPDILAAEIAVKELSLGEYLSWCRRQGLARRNFNLGALTAQAKIFREREEAKRQRNERARRARKALRAQLLEQDSQE